jgi:uncharacterized protein (TIGR03435 family)
MKAASLIRTSVCIAILLASFGSTPLAVAQNAAGASSAPQPEFEAVSIHLIDPHDTGERHGFSMSTLPTNLFTMRSATLTYLIELGYKIERPEDMFAMPSWMESQEYDISAKVEGDQPLTLEQLRPLIRRLLEQRFHLVSHREIKMTSGFELTVAKGGPKLQPSNVNTKPSAGIHSDQIDVQHGSMERIASMLSLRAGKPIIDRTGLSGNYDVTLSYAKVDDPNSDLPDFFTALQNQLGLKLVPAKVPVQILVIDHVDKTPTEN